MSGTVSLAGFSGEWFNGRVQAFNGHGRMVFEEVARRVVPDVTGLGEADRQRFLEIVDNALMERPITVRRQLLLLLGVIRWLPLMRWGHWFEGLSEDRQDAMLRFFQDGPIGPLREGFWGLKALVFMGYYGREAAWEEVGYDPDVEGNERLHGNP